MNFKQIRRDLRLGVALLAGVAAFGTASAQIGPGGFAEDAGSALNRNLKELANAPRSLSALLGAAKAALELGDPQAAVTFYARAEEVAPRDGRIKAGMGAAFLAMEQPVPALKFLDEARGLGLPEGVIAADRGLAHDLLGDPLQAQRDYAVAMRTNDNDELRRRLALSRAISGDRGGALSALDDQVRRRSPAGSRVRAFVLALTGDTAGATDAARAVMPGQAAAMQPFFARLPSLRPAERAMAVHFGRFPGDAPPGQVPVTTSTYAGLPPDVIFGGRPDATQTGLQRRIPLPEPVSTASRRRPGEAEERTQLAARADGLSAPIGRPVTPVQVAPSQPLGTSPPQSGQSSAGQTTTQQPTATASAAPVPQVATQPIRPGRVPLPRVTSPAREPRISGFELARGITTRRRVTSGSSGSQAEQTAASRSATTSSNVLEPAAGAAGSSQQLALNSVTRPVSFGSSQSDVAVARPAPASPTPGFGIVQGPPNENMPPVNITSTSASVVNNSATPVWSPPAAVEPTTAAVPTALTAVGMAPGAQAGTSQSAPSGGIATMIPPPSIVAPPADAPVAAQAATPVAVPTVAPQSQPLPSSVVPSTGLASLAATIRALPATEPEPARPSRQSAVKPPPVVKKPEPAKSEAAKPKEPSRHWVQVAGSADKAGLAREYSRIRTKAPKLLAGKTAWTTPLRFTNRLLVGPFKSDGEAQAFVNELAKSELTAFTWTSPAGQEIVKLAAK